MASGQCGSLATARMVLQATVPEMSQQIWEELRVAVEEYLHEKGRVHCRGLDSEPTALDCSGMAALVMDLLLHLLNG